MAETDLPQPPYDTRHMTATLYLGCLALPMLLHLAGNTKGLSEDFKSFPQKQFKLNADSHSDQVARVLGEVLLRGEGSLCLSGRRAPKIVMKIAGRSTKSTISEPRLRSCQSCACR